MNTIRNGLLAAALLGAALPALAGGDEPKAQPGQTVTLTLHLASSRPISALTLLDSNGQPVYEGKPEGDLTLEGLQPGLYVAWIKVGRRVLTERIRVRES